MNAHLRTSFNLAWQSRLLLGAVLAMVCGSVMVQAAALARPASRLVVVGAIIGGAFGLLVWLLRAATAGAAFTGGLFTVAFYLASPGWRTLLWPLLALFLLTFAATRFGRPRKEKLKLAEERQGRSASQVAANLGVAALTSIPVSASRLLGIQRGILGRVMLVALIAALAEATADTLSSELGEVLGGEPWLLTTLKRVPVGTDGGISVAGTLAGCGGAAVITLIAALVLPLRPVEGLAALAAGVLGLFIDSLLGATVERSGGLNNDAVNFFSTCASGIVGVLLAEALKAS